MRKENLKRKGVDDAENASDNEDRETSPVADNGGDDAEVKNAANDNTEENGDSKELGTDEEFVDAENGEDKVKGKDKTNGNDDEKEDNGEEEEEVDVPLKKSGRTKPKPAKKAAAAAAEGNGDVKANGDDQEDEEKEEDGEEAEDAEGDDVGEDKNDDGSDYESAPKKSKKGAGKRAAPKKKEVKKAAKPKPAKKTKKQEIEEEEEDEEVEYEVQDIVDHRKERGGKMVYRIRWKNFGAKDDTWEPEATLSCPDIIKRYKAKLAEKEKEEEDEDVEYEVEDIIDHRKERGGKMVYRIRWKNFKAADDTWEPEATLTCPDIIKRYKAKLEKEDSAPPAKKGKPAPKGKKGAAGKKATPKPSPKKRSAKESEDDDEDEDDEEDGAEYEVEKIIDVHFKRNGKRDYLVRWKGFSSKDDTWEPEEHLNCKDLIAKFNEKLDKSKNATVKELRVNRKPTERLHLVEIGRKTSRRNAGKTRVNYYDGE